MKTFFIHTFGCKTNQLESSVIEKQMIESGMLFEKDFDKADINIINSCTVTSKADDEVKYLVRRIKRANSNTKIVVTGCFAQVAPDVLKNLEEVDLVLGNAEKFNFIEHVQKLGQEKIHVADIFSQKSFENFDANDFQNRTRANLKIQDGCNNRCSYCIIPYARGKSRSNALSNIIEQVDYFVQKDFKEIVLTGIHLGQWGLDFAEKLEFVDLIKALEQLDGLQRYRIGSLDPNEISDEIIDIWANSKKCCKHAHISLQSVDDSILKSMRRKYRVEDCFNVINKLTAKIPEIAIGCDIIAGFPGETEEMFNNTYNNLKELPLSYFHVFPYSIRTGTPAASMPDQIPQKIKKQRAEKLKALSRKKNFEYKKAFLGKTLDVLVEKKRNKATNSLKGLASNYISMYLEGGDSYKNKIVKVKITEITESKVYGKFL